MGWFITSIVFFILGAIALPFFLNNRKKLKAVNASLASSESGGYRGSSRLEEEQDGRTILNRILMGAVLFLFLFSGLSLGLSSFTIVSPRHIGIPVTLGAVGDPIDSGPSPKLPWTDVIEVDTTVQNINLDTDIPRWLNESVCTAVTVRLASGATACVNITSQWNVADNATEASELWSSYRGRSDDADPTNDNFITNLRNNVVDREIQRAMNAAFATYNPIVVGVDGQVTNTPLDLAAYSETVRDDLVRSMDKGINVGEFLISMVHYDKVTQEKINGLAQAKADTQIAIQNRLTAEQVAAANELLAASDATEDPGVMFQNCLNMIERLASSGQLANLPVNTVVCALNSNGVPIIVNGQQQ